MWTTFMAGLFTLAAVGFIFIVLDQAYNQNIRPWGIREGTDADNLKIIDVGWQTILIPVVIAYVLAQITTGRSQSKSIISE